MATIPIGELREVTKEWQPILSGLYNDNLVGVNIIMNRKNGDQDGRLYLTLFSDVPSYPSSNPREMAKLTISDNNSSVSLRRYGDKLLIKKKNSFNSLVKARGWCLA